MFLQGKDQSETLQRKEPRGKKREEKKESYFGDMIDLLKKTKQLHFTLEQSLASCCRSATLSPICVQNSVAPTGSLSDLLLLVLLHVEVT